MMSLVSLVALSASIADMTQPPAWQTDYQAALIRGTRRHKPLAVFLAPGKEGWHKLSQKGSLPREVQQVLDSRYVPVFIDTATARGKVLASAFELPGGIGMVLSDREGHYQTFRHEGILAPEHLAGALERHANGEQPVQRTETNQVTLETSSPYGGVAPVALEPVYASTCSH
jgi:hypothetical protein